MSTLVAGVVGAPLGVVLFWAVTRTDATVPDAIVPGQTIAVLMIGVPLVAAALTAAFTGDGTPAVSRRALV